ncbi:MAG: FAD-dependent oxidoreductase [Rhodobacteraceae bacterium]|nr:FAD-dependent oxidoreductase [Paracoccaceae bacterium]
MKQPDPQVIIIGAGAAGVGAAMECQARGIAATIYEAADRVGGRAHTASAGLPVAWDHGCHWLHCADQNPLVAMADRFGVAYDRSDREGAYVPWANGRFSTPAETDAAIAAIEKGFARIEIEGGAGRDVAVSELLDPDDPAAAHLRYIVQLMAGDDPEDVSAAAYTDYAETNTNWAMTGGYGTLVARMAEGIDIRLNSPVTALEQTAEGVTVQVGDKTLRADAAIVTVSTNVLISGAIRFGPGPAADLLPLIADVPCGAYEKVAVALKQMPEPFRGKGFSMMTDTDGRALNFQIVNSEHPLLIAHMAGDVARSCRANGQDGAQAYVVGWLERAFGPGIHDSITGIAVTGWSDNPWVRGSYSHARPGKTASRHRMIAADTGNLAFAGEAFSMHWQATAHGAYQSGRDVAARIAEGLASR